MSGFYDREGYPISMREWAVLLGDFDYKRVAATDVGDYWVSTVWIGLDHGHSYSEEPLIFETMVFRQRRDVLVDGDVACWRYSSEDQAREGHERMVEEVRLLERAFS